MPNIHQVFTFHRFDKEIVELYSAHTIRRFALALIGIFEPVYIFIYFNNSFTKALLFFASFHLLYGVFVPFGAKIAVKLGLKKSMLISLPFIFLYYVVLWQLDLSFLLIFLAIALRFFYGILYWPAYHIDMARFSKTGIRGEQISVATVVYNLAAVLGPFLGGLIILSFGWPVLFVMVLILLFIAAIPLLFSKEVYEIYTDSYEKAFKYICSKKNINETIAFAVYGFDVGVSMYIWPIFLFILAINFQTIGLISSGALFLSLLFVLYIGEATDQFSKKRLLRIGSILTSIVWIIKTFVRTAFDAFLAHVAYRFAFSAASIPFAAIFYDKASEKKDCLDRYIVFREMAHNLGRAFMFIVLAIVFIFVPVSKIYLIFPLAAVFALPFMLLMKKKVSQNEK